MLNPYKKSLCVRIFVNQLMSYEQDFKLGNVFLLVGVILTHLLIIKKPYPKSENLYFSTQNSALRTQHYFQLKTLL